MASRPYLQRASSRLGRYLSSYAVCRALGICPTSQTKRSPDEEAIRDTICAFFSSCRTPGLTVRRIRRRIDATTRR
jgi:hypothetical protein